MFRVAGLNSWPPALNDSLITIYCFSQIQVSGNIPCRLGALLLTASNIRVLGGSVQILEGNSYWNVLHQAM